MKPSRLWRRGQAGWPRRFPLVQFPNLPLLVALLARAASGAVRPDGREQAALGRIARLGMGVWAWEELIDGDNWFRRLLGAAGLAWVAADGGGAPVSRAPAP